MAAWDEALGAVTSGGGQTIWAIAFIVIGSLVGVLILGVAAWWWWSKKRWNLKVEIKLPRSDGRLVNAEWGKGYFNAKRGVCYIKRPGLGQRAVPIRIFDIRKYIQGDNIITVMQLSPDDFRMVLNNSWEEYEDDKPMKDKEGNVLRDKEGKLIYERAGVINIKIDPGFNKAWRAAWDGAAKQAYSLKSFFTQFQTPIAIGIVIIACFVGFAIIWSRLGSIC